MVIEGKNIEPLQIPTSVNNMEQQKKLYVYTKETYSERSNPPTTGEGLDQEYELLTWEPICL